jgi:hypothetical protein
MASIGQENLETVTIDFFGALRRGDFQAAAEQLDPDVSWRGCARSGSVTADRRCSTRSVGDSSSAARSTHSSSRAPASGWCWGRAGRASAR